MWREGAKRTRGLRGADGESASSDLWPSRMAPGVGSDAMHDGLYADTLDVFKWSVVVDVVEQERLKAVLYVAMLTNRAGAQEGEKRYEPGYARGDVARFFTAERARIKSGKAKREARRVAALGRNCDPSFTIEVVEQTFVHSTRAEYFEEVAAVASAHREPILAFFDPDTGFAPQKPNERHVKVAEVRGASLALPAGSAVIVFQYRPQRWSRAVSEEAARIQLANALDVAATDVSVQSSNDVVLAIGKKPVTP